METVKTGVVAELGGKYWGVTHAGGGHGEGTSYGWGDIDKAKVSDPEFCHSPADMVYRGSPYARELAYAKLRQVRITTFYEVFE